MSGPRVFWTRHCAGVGLSWLLLLAASCARVPRGPAQAKPWQELKLRSLDGQARSVADYRGKVVLLDFWASWCEPCRHSMPFYQRLHGELSPAGFTVVGVTLDEDAADAQAVVTREGLRFPILWDPNAELPELLNVQIMPTALLLGKDGHLQFRHQGFVEGDEQEIRSRVETLLAGQ